MRKLVSTLFFLSTICVTSFGEAPPEHAGKSGGVPKILNDLNKRAEQDSGKQIFIDRSGKQLYAIGNAKARKKAFNEAFDKYLGNKGLTKEGYDAKSSLEKAEAIKEFIQTERLNIDVYTHVYGQLAMIRLLVMDKAIVANDKNLQNDSEKIRLTAMDGMKEIARKLNLDDAYWDYKDEENEIISKALEKAFSEIGKQMAEGLSEGLSKAVNESIDQIEKNLPKEEPQKQRK